jgi:hypothetical protein
MANELQQLPNPTNIPEAVSTGYQRQNTNTLAIQTGLDTTHPVIINNGNSILIYAGGVIEVNGSLFKIINDATIDIPNIHKDYYLYVRDNGDGTADLKITDVYPTFVPSKNGWYTSKNERVLNHFYMLKTLVKKDINNENIGAITFLNLESQPVIMDIMPNLSARSELAAATLGDGSVLFAGGCNPNVSNYIFNIVERYDNDGVKTTLTTLLQTSRDLAGASLGDGSVLFGGGYYYSSGQISLDIVNRYDMDFVRTTVDNLSIARHNLQAATLGAGSVLFGGGINSSGSASASVTVDKYDINGVRTTLINLNYEHSQVFTAATLGDGSVLFGGGIYPSINPSNRVEKYDIYGVKTILPDLSAARAWINAATLGDGSVLFGGGYNMSTILNNVDRYDTNGVRTSLTGFSQPRYGYSAVSLGNGSVLFAGGVIGSSTNSVTDIVESYDINFVRTTLTSLSVARMTIAGATLGSGSVLFGGGAIGNTPSTVVERYSALTEITLAYGSKYRFNDDTYEKVATKTIYKTTPNRGYIRYNSTTTI